MSNSISDDYFTFMSGRGHRKAAQSRHAVETKRTPKVAAPPEPDTIEFEDDSQMVVTETSISDTMIQRIFRRPEVG